MLGVNTTGHPGSSLDDPLRTVTTGGHHMLIAPMLTQYHSETCDKSVRGQRIDQPMLTLDTSNRYGLVAAFLAKHYGGNYNGSGNSVEQPLSTVTTVDHNALVMAHITPHLDKSVKDSVDQSVHAVSAENDALVTSRLIKLRGTCRDGQEVTKPMPTITAGGLHVGEVRAFLLKYYGNADNGQELDTPLHTVTTKDRFGLVTVQGIDYQIIDIGMRMLEPHELFAAQGFPENYTIDTDADGKKYSKSAQVARCGNAVPPPFAQALVRANLPELCTGSGNKLTVERYKKAVGQVEFSL